MPEPSHFLHFISDGVHPGAFNMQMDEMLFRRAIRAKEINATLRFYRFSEPCWTVGYGIWKSASASSETMPAIRRLTGGGIVKHGEDLTYALVAPYHGEEPLARVRKSYFFIHEALCCVLHKFGLKAERYASECESGKFCFDSPVTDDVMLRGKKVAGGAQKRSQGYLLHQGSIAWPLLLEAKFDLNELRFARAFADELGNSLGLLVKESSLETEDIEYTGTGHMAWHRLPK